MDEPKADGRSSAAEQWEEGAISIGRLRRGRRRFDSPLVNLTSMVDVLSVLMFFLLSIYSGGGYLTLLPSGLDLPASNVRVPLKRHVEVAVLRDKILVEREPVADRPEEFETNDALVLPALQAALAARGGANDGDERASVTIEADRSIPFRLLKKVLYTVDQAGFRMQSLAVRQVNG